ncbi:hypothetical protein [Arthrobacter woluwensis]|uniref:hypothetical protein n=1 Tax=Arthrobacter woluwensis TaxID=156980 RepID=UPI0011A66DD7|nr:hypothetical protein [Arthrobacter woluwensis]
MGAPILRTTDLDTLADNIVSRILAALDDSGLIELPTLPDAEVAGEDIVSYASVADGAVVQHPEPKAPADSADAQAIGEPAQADAQSEEVPPPAEEKAPAPAPAPKVAKAEGKAQPDLLGLGDYEDDE